MRLCLAAACAALLLAPATAAAHVKWFAPYDLSLPPRDLGEVLRGAFVWLFIVSTFAIYAFFLVDRMAFRRRFLAEPLDRLKLSQEGAFLVMRLATAGLFLALFVMSLTSGAVYLTPELHTDSRVLPFVQLALGGLALFARSAPLAGLGVLVIYLMAVRTYGAYHLLDYLVFPALAVFLGLSFLRGAAWVKARYVVLFAATGIMLGWGAIEKFAYPGWFYPLLQETPQLLMGMHPAFYVTLAGFVEFNLAFVMLASASVLSRVIALGLNGIFILAIDIFGWTDAVGHLVLMAVLVVLALRGPTPARNFLVLSEKSVWAEAYFMTGLWMLAMNVLFLGYYGLHALQYR